MYSTDDKYGIMKVENDFVIKKKMKVGRSLQFNQLKHNENNAYPCSFPPLLEG